METLSLRWFSQGTRSEQRSAAFAVHPMEITRLAARWAVAGTVAIAVILVAIWAASTPSVDQYFAAGLWAAGFVFFGLALEVNIRKIFRYLFTGMALPVLAVMGAELAAEFSMVGGAVIAGWLGVWIVRRR